MHVSSVSSKRLGPSARLDLDSTRSMYGSTFEADASSQYTPTNSQESLLGEYPLTRQAEAESLSTKWRHLRLLSSPAQVLRAIGPAKISSCPMKVCFGIHLWTICGGTSQLKMLKARWTEIGVNKHSSDSKPLTSLRNVRGISVKDLRRHGFSTAGLSWRAVHQKLSHQAKGCAEAWINS